MYIGKIRLGHSSTKYRKMKPFSTVSADVCNAGHEWRDDRSVLLNALGHWYFSRHYQASSKCATLSKKAFISRCEKTCAIFGGESGNVVRIK